jgi:UPF0755 protein
MPGGRPEERRRARRSTARPYALDGEQPSVEATRRLLAERRAQIARDGRRAGGRGGGRRTRRGRGPDDPDRQRTFRRRRVAAVAAVVLLAIGAWFLVSLFQPFKGQGHGEVAVTIPDGAGVAEIGDLLEDEGVISSSFFFQLRARLGDAADDLKSGSFSLSEDMSYSAALDALSVGPAPANVVEVTIPEGGARSEVAPVVEDAGIEGDYEEASIESNELDPADYGAERAESLEGFLFPSTYELKRNATAEDLVEDQLAAFEEEFEKVDLTQAERANLTPYDVLTIASMVEREAQIPEERPLIAGVIYNRLRDGIPLGIDATTRYALDNWTEPLVESDFDPASAYNTRANPGLPPTPIGNPGLDSIEAAADPEETDFLYFVVKPGTCGEHEFNETLEGHEAAVAAYEQARAEAGYRSPTACPE